MVVDTNAVFICKHLCASYEALHYMLWENLFHVRTDCLNMSYNLATSLCPRNQWTGRWCILELLMSFIWLGNPNSCPGKDVVWLDKP